jgi:cell fate regulator YaaT (PSP1 superfamily)
LVQLGLHHFRHEAAMAETGLGLVVGDWVVFRDQTGDDIGRVLGSANDEVRSANARTSDFGLRTSDCPRVVRKALEADLRRRSENEVRAQEALQTFRGMVEQSRLPMRPIDAYLRLDAREICFYFVSEERLNFRALHKAISSVLGLRVAIRQVGVRDYSRVLGGIGPCGRVSCCAGFLRDLKPITLRMARQQSLFVEPSKISGICGKLLCCLGFEESANDEVRSANVRTSDDERRTITR